MKKKDFILGSIVVVVALGIFSKFTGTICIIRGITGIPCPGCGMTRAYKALVSGHITQAFIYHPLFLMPVIAAIIYFLKKKYFNNVVIIFGIIFLGLYIFRMVLLFPNEYPMKYNDKALIPQVVQEITHIYTKSY